MIHQASSGGYILAESATHHHWHGRQMASIKCFLRGEARYRVDNALHLVGNGAYFLLNDGQEYEILIESETAVESFCVFLPTHILRDALPHDIDLLTPAGSALPAFYEHVHPPDDDLLPALLALRRDLAHLDRFALDERLHLLATCLLRQHHVRCASLLDLPLARASTRDEIYRRVYRARDTMLALLDQPLTLDDLARVAYLSPNHFLRSFKQVFRETPYQFLRRQRLEKARRLLAETSLTVTEVCFAVGYRSLGSFSAAFSRHFGLPPSAVREKGDFGEGSSV